MNNRIVVKEDGKENHKWWHFLFGTSERWTSYRGGFTFKDEDKHTSICNKCGYCKITSTYWD